MMLMRASPEPEEKPRRRRRRKLKEKPPPLVQIRPPGTRLARSTHPRQLREIVQIGRLLYPEAERRSERPATRAGCANGVRPCPFVSCRHHLALDVREGGALVELFPGVPIWDMPRSCALDEVDGPKTLDEVGAILGITRERVRQIERSAMAKVRAALAGEAREDFPEPTEDMWSL